MVLAGLSGCGTSIEGFDTVTDRGGDIANLFNVALVISMLVFLLVAGLLITILIRFRGRPGDAEPPQVEGNRRLEIIWTAAPALLLAVLFVLVVLTMRRVESAAAGPLRVEVIGHQWWWEYRYPDLGITTANELHVPVGAPLRFAISSDDVVHSWWVPRFGWKKDAIPGQTNTITLTVEEAGRYDGACTEYCLAQHAWMRVHVVAEPRDQFDAWVRLQQTPPPAPTDPQARRGQQLLLSNTCVNCHAIRGTAAGGRVGPELTYLGRRAFLGAGVVENTPANLARFIHDVQAIKPGVRMPAFGFSDEELAALAAYLDSLK